MRALVRLMAAACTVAITVPGVTACTGPNPPPTPSPGARCARTTSPFAVAASTGSSRAPKQWAAVIAKTGVCTVRGFADDAADVAVQTGAGLSLTGILMWSPDESHHAFPVDDIPGWQSYVRRMVAAYPHVDHWEIWNEPPNFTTDTDPAHYAKVVQAAYDTVKQIDPRLQVGIAVKSTNIRWLAEAIAAGARHHFDYVALHPYERAELLPTGNEIGFLSIVPTLRAMLRDVAPDQAAVPVVFSEVGIPTSVKGRSFDITTVSADVQADVLVKVYAMGLAQGVRMIAWFDPWDGDYIPAGQSDPPYGLVAKNGTPRPACTALTSLIGALGQDPTYLGQAQLGGSGHGYVFAFAAGSDVVLVAWASGGTGPVLTFGQDVQVTAPSTGSSTRSTSVRLRPGPVLIRTTGKDAADWRSRTGATPSASASASASGQPTDPATVSYSAKDGADGLTWVGPPQTSVVDGRAAVPMSATPTAKLIVDPRFSVWTPTAVTVSVQVHQLGGGAGLNLKYDANAPVATLDWAGEKVAGNWQAVPDGGWTTLTWHVPDASFVGMFGFELQLDSDSTDHSSYAISNISVTRG